MTDPRTSFQAHYLWPLLTRALNKALVYAPAARSRLTAIGVQTWRLHIEDLALGLDLYSDGTQLHIHSPDDTAPDADIRGHSRDFLTLLQSTDKTATLASLPIRIEGSTRSFMQLQALADDLDIDWEAWLGDLIGDLPAHQLAGAGRRVGEQVSTTARSFQRATERYVIREKRWLVTRPEADALLQDIHGLRRRLDKLSGQVRSLKTASTRTEPSDNGQGG